MISEKCKVQDKPNLYLYEEMLERYKNITTYEFQDIKRECVDGGIVFPSQFLQSSMASGISTDGGVCGNDGSFYGISANTWGIREKYLECDKKIYVEPCEYIDEEVVYIGCLSSPFYAYGNYILDVLGRLWVFLHGLDKGKKVCYISDGKEGRYLELFYLFGLKKENMIRIDKPTRFKKVVVPEQSVYLGCCYHRYFREIIDEIRSNVPAGKYKKVYLSRRKLEVSKTFGEQEIETIFSKNGFKVVFPESLPLREQISLMKGAEFVAGTIGSAMHNVIFANDGTVCYYFNRNAYFNNNQIMIDSLIKAKGVYIDAFENILPSRFCYVPYFLSCNKHVISFFKDYGLKFNVKDIYKNIERNFLDFVYEMYVVNEDYKKQHVEELVPPLPETFNLQNFLTEMHFIKEKMLILQKIKKVKNYKVKLFFYRYILFNSKKSKKIQNKLSVILSEIEMLV